MGNEFDSLFWATGVQRNAHLAHELVILGDGAEWIWNLVKANFPNAVQINVVGVQGYWPPESAGDYLLVPDNCVHMSVAGTRVEARGRGIGTLLTKVGLAQARAAGYRFCETDWRSTNLLASRFWPRRGFRPAAYRLVRRVDERIAWAHGQQ